MANETEPQLVKILSKARSRISDELDCEFKEIRLKSLIVKNAEEYQLLTQFRHERASNISTRMAVYFAHDPAPSKSAV